MKMTRDDRELRKNLLLVAAIFGLAWLVCRWAGSEASKTNSYTRYHLTINEGIFGTLTSTLAFWIIKETLFFCGKPENICFYIILESFMILLRLSLLVLFCQKTLIEMTVPMLNNWFFIIGANWWKNKNDPFITNASYINAFLCWVVCTFMWILLIGTVIFVLHCVRGRNYKFLSLFKFKFHWQMLQKYVLGLN